MRQPSEWREWQRPLPLWIGALLAAPVALYLSGTPMFRLGGLIPVAALTLAAITCTRQPRWHSMACVAVYAVFVAALAVIVFGAQ